MIARPCQMVRRRARQDHRATRALRAALGPVDEVGRARAPMTTLTDELLRLPPTMVRL
jgi:hypothetical protein